MLDKLQRNKQSLPDFNPSRYGPPGSVAMKTSWKYLKQEDRMLEERMAEVYQLVRVTSNRMAFLSQKNRIYLKTSFLIVILFFITLATSKNMSEASTSLLLVIPVLLFAVLSLSPAPPIVFDKHKGFFWIGGKASDLGFDKKVVKHLTSLDQVHALQLLAMSGNHYVYYQLNLVLEDCTRIYLLTYQGLHNDSKGQLNASHEASVLAQFLGKPLWDATWVILKYE